MRAAVVVQDAGGKRLEVRDVAEPVPGESEVLVRVRTAGANRADLSMNVGHFRGAGAAGSARCRARICGRSGRNWLEGYGRH